MFQLILFDNLHAECSTKYIVKLCYAKPFLFLSFSSLRPFTCNDRRCQDDIERELLHRQQARIIESIKSAARSALCSPLTRPSVALLITLISLRILHRYAP